MAGEALRIIKRRAGNCIAFVFPITWKHQAELRFWKKMVHEEYGGHLRNDWYEPL
jgi:hypothetical protein